MSGTRKRVVDREGLDKHDDLAARFDRGEDILSDDDQVVDVVFKRPLDHVIPVRLASDDWKALHREARDQGIGPTTLARMWLIERLRAIEAGMRGRVAVREERARYAAGKRAAGAAVRKQAAGPATGGKRPRSRTR